MSGNPTYCAIRVVSANLCYIEFVGELSFSPSPVSYAVKFRNTDSNYSTEYFLSDPFGFGPLIGPYALSGTITSVPNSDTAFNNAIYQNTFTFSAETLASVDKNGQTDDINIIGSNHETGYITLTSPVSWALSDAGKNLLANVSYTQTNNTSTYSFTDYTSVSNLSQAFVLFAGDASCDLEGKTGYKQLAAANAIYNLVKN